MKNACRLITTAACAVFLVCAVRSMAVDWSQWRGANRDGKATNFTAPKTWPAALTQQWKVNVGLGDASPALVGKMLYLSARQGDNEVTLCLDAATGKEIWRDQFAAPAIGGPASGHPGPRGTPAVAAGKVVTLGVYGALSCLDAATGKVVWRKTDITGMPMFGTGMSPIIVGKMCIANLGGRDNGAINAYDLATGALVWTCPGQVPSYSSPILMTVNGVKQLVIYTDKNLEGVSLADGKVLWKVPAQPNSRYYNSATPIIDGQTVICTGQGQGTKALKIDKTGDTFTAAELWNNKDLGVGYCSPVLQNGMLYGISDKGSYFFMNAQTGQTLWIDSVTRRENYGCIVDAGNILLGLPNDSTLSVFEPNAAKFSELAKIKVAETPTYAFPVVSGKNIYIKDLDSLMLYAVE